MRLVNELLRLSATDLANHLSCAHLTQQSRAVALGRARKPEWHDPVAAILQQRGIEHEQAYLEHLRRAEALDVVQIPDDARDGVEHTRAAMRAGASLIYQAPLGNARWYGRADFLRRVATPSALGEWSYEVVDAKLATETRAGTILQLCVYSELVAAIQRDWPEHAYVVAPHHGFEPEPHRLADYAAYYRLVRGGLERAIASSAATYPEPVMHCEVCAWWGPCNARRRADDHLCFVAGISRLQINELRRIDVDGLERLAELDRVPTPKRGSREALARVRDQAAIQLRARRLATPQYEILEPVDAAHGLAMLPEPCARDAFLDLEGDRLATDGGRDYLFGYVVAGDYTPVWALTPAEEKRAFEALVDTILAAFETQPEMHVYHFGAYEPNAFKRLAGRYATRENALDTLLRAEVFIDLHAVVKHALKAGVESYSIKELEQFYGLERAQDMREATSSRRAIEWAIEMRETIRDDARFAAHFAAVERYNREDCVSAARLRDWLETLRAEQTARGIALPRPELKSGEAGERIEETTEETRRVAERLLEGVPVDAGERDAEQHARWLMAHLLEWHRREDKAAWWEFFRLRDLGVDAYTDERSALADLELVETVGGTVTRPVRRYAFPLQDHDVRSGDDLHLPGDGTKIGEIESLDLSRRTIDVRHAGKWADAEPAHVFVSRIVRPGSKPAALLELGRSIAERGANAPGPHRAARDLMLRLRPRLVAGSRGLESDRGEGVDDEVATARRLALELDAGVLPIQGPPGTGKTFTGSRMIVELVKAGKKVGVTAVSHEVIRNLLKGCIEAAEAEGLDGFACLHKGKPKDTNPATLEATDDYKRVHALFDPGDAYGVLGGTSWLWARDDFVDSVDVLFVDEAGQMSLADVLAVARCARSLVLLGDPQQLEQPQQASHPPGTDVSALEHILGGDKTLAPEAGLFLRSTRRLHPSICAFTAELFYESRLHAHAGLENQAVTSAAPFPDAGLVYVPVAHEGNQSRATEEVEAIAELFAALTSGHATWRDEARRARPLAADDVMIVAPYNAQVTALSAELPGARVGTVDKFQGQQAPVVVISLTTSTPDDAPRGMSFLYSANRLNVATSRAKALCILVGNPRLFEPDCRTPEQMRLANAFCRYLELAHAVRRE